MIRSDLTNLQCGSVPSGRARLLSLVRSWACAWEEKFLSSGAGSLTTAPVLFVALRFSPQRHFSLML